MKRKNPWHFEYQQYKFIVAKKNANNFCQLECSHEVEQMKSDMPFKKESRLGSSAALS